MGGDGYMMTWNTQRLEKNVWWLNRWLKDLGQSSKWLTKKKMKGKRILGRENCICKDLRVITGLTKLKGRRRNCVLEWKVWLCSGMGQRGPLKREQLRSWSFVSRTLKESHFEILTEKLMPLLEKNFGWSPECRLKKERCEYTGYSSEEARAVVQVRLRGFIQKQRVGERVNGNSPGSTELAVWA